MYLDHAATTPLDPEVLACMMPYVTNVQGNPSSVHAAGRRARAAIERAREQVASLVGAHPAEVVFTSGGTEADSFALHIAAAFATGQRATWVSSTAEHHAILVPMMRRMKRGGAVQLLDVDATARVPEEAVISALDEHVALLSLMHVNNETGVVCDIAAMAAHAHQVGALFHTDAVQSAGKLPLDVHAMALDLVSISAHKLQGPKGTGALIVRRGIDVDPLLPGGAQERGRRGGTENVAAIVGFGAAAQRALEQRETRVSQWLRQRGDFLSMLRRTHPSIVVNGEGASLQPGILSVSFPFAAFGIDGEALLLRMDLEGVAISSGSACTAGSVEASHVMQAIGHDEATARATVRISLGAQTTDAEVRDASEILVRIVEEMRRRP